MTKYQPKFTALIVVMAFLLAGCSSSSNSASDDSSGTSNSSGVDLKVEIDPASSSVTLPEDRFHPSFNDEMTIDEAYDAAITKCARKLDIPMTASRAHTNPVYDMWYRFGPWTTDMAQQFGFVPPMSIADMQANGIKGAPVPPRSADEDEVQDLPQAELDKALEQCADDPDVKYFGAIDDGYGGPWQADFNQTYDKTVKDSEAQKVFKELATCYDSKGMVFDQDKPGFVTAADPNLLNEEQIELAVKVAQCQESTDSIARLAGILGEYQAPTIEKYSAELAEINAQQEEGLAKAKEFTTENSDVFEPIEN